MATQVQRRRGNTAQHAGFIGAVGETTYDDSIKRPVVHDGLTPGGFPAAMLHVANVFSQPQTIAVASGAPIDAFTILVDGVARLTARKEGFVQITKQEPDTSQGGIDIRRRGTTGNALAALSSGSGIGEIEFNGWDGAAFELAGHIRYFTTQAWAPGAHGSKLFLSTTAIGSAVSTVSATLSTTELEVFSRLLLPNTTSATVGGIYFGGARALHNFGVNSMFGGVNSGNLTLTGTDNTGFGRNTGYALTSGAYNAFFGASAGRNTTTGSQNSFFGRTAGFTNNTGIRNSFFGFSAGYANSSGGYNAFFGRLAGAANTTASNNAFFGAGAGDVNTTASNNSFFGKDAGGANIVGTQNAFFGASAGLLNTASYNTFFGALCGDANTSATGNSFFGSAAGGANNTGASNSFFGRLAGTANTTGGANCFFGLSSGAANLIGNNNAFFGTQTGLVNTGGYNCFFGSDSGLANTSATQNCFFGFNSGKTNITGISNCFFGSQCGRLSTANYNSFFGRSAGEVVSTGANNCFFGHNAGVLNTTGNNNSFFGRTAGDNLTSGNLNIVIGANIDAPVATGSGQMTLGNLIFATGIDGVGLGISSGNVGVAVITPHSGLQVGRSFALPYRATAVTTTFLATDYTIDATSGTFTVNLPTAVGITGRIYVIKNSGVGTITLDPAGAELIDSLATATVVSGASITTQSTGTGWIII